jgi:hypothetical protein
MNNKVLHLFINDRVFVSLDKEELQRVGDLFLSLDLATRFCIIPLDFLIKDAYVL